MKKICINCGREIDAECSFCPHCGANQTITNESFNPNSENPNNTQNYQQNNNVQKPDNTAHILGILSIVFGALGGFLGLIFGIIGIVLSKNPNDKKLNIIGLCLFGAWVIISILLFSVGLSLI